MCVRFKIKPNLTWYIIFTTSGTLPPPREQFSYLIRSFRDLGKYFIIINSKNCISSYSKYILVKVSPTQYYEYLLFLTPQVGKFGFIRAYLRTEYLQLVIDESCRSWNVRNCRWRNTSGVGSQIQSGMLAGTVDVRRLIAGKTPSFTVPGSWTSWWSWNSETRRNVFTRSGSLGLQLNPPCADFGCCGCFL